jgi:hypothetical protein
MLLASVTLAALTACTSSGQPSTSSTASPDAPQVTTSAGVEVPMEFVTASTTAFPDIDAAKTYEEALLICGILSNVNGDQEEAHSLLQSEVALSADDARTYLRLAIQFVCPDQG